MSTGRIRGLAAVYALGGSTAVDNVLDPNREARHRAMWAMMMERGFSVSTTHVSPVSSVRWP